MSNRRPDEIIDKKAIVSAADHFYVSNDNIYIVRNRNGINAENLATVLKRNDIKKSDAYQSGFLEGTTPMYDSYIKLKKSLIQFHKEEV